MADVFQPQVAQINSSVTPQEAVVDTSAVDLFADVARVASEATFGFAGQQELSDLRSKFGKITQMRASGAKSSAMLQVDARAHLDAARANSPWIAQEADRLFRDTFGSGSSGTFKLSPQEEAREKHAGLLEETRLKLGLGSTEEAQKRVSLDENAKSAKIQADAQKNVREYNGELVFSNTQAQLTNNTIKFMDAMTISMDLGGGTISNDEVRSFNLTIDQQALVLKQELNSQTRDAKTGHLLIDKAGYDSNLKEIEDWVTDTRAMASDNAYLKTIQDLNTEQNAEINFIASSKYRSIKEIEATFGQSGVSEYLRIALMPEGTAKQLMHKRSKMAAAGFDQPGSYTQAVSTGSDKIILPTPGNIMSQQEALALGNTLNDPANSKMLTIVADKVGSEPEAVAPFESMIQQDTDSSAMLWTEKLKNWSKTEPAKASVVVGAGVSALKKAFLATYVSDNGTLPSDFEVKIAQSPNLSSPAQSGLGSLSTPKNRVVGDGLDTTTAGMLVNMYKVISSHPAQLKEIQAAAGVPDLTAEQAVRFVVTGKTPIDEAPVDELPKASPITSSDVVNFLSGPGDKWTAQLKKSAEETARLMGESGDTNNE